MYDAHVIPHVLGGRDDLLQEHVGCISIMHKFPEMQLVVH